MRGVKSEAVEASSSSYEEAEAEPSQPSAAPKATGELLPAQGQQQPKEPRTSEAERVPAKGESLPKAERPATDAAQGDYWAR